MINHAVQWGLPKRAIGGAWLYIKGYPYSFWFPSQELAECRAKELADLGQGGMSIGLFAGKLIHGINN